VVGNRFLKCVVTAAREVDLEAGASQNDIEKNLERSVVVSDQNSWGHFLGPYCALYA